MQKIWPKSVILSAADQTMEPTTDLSLVHPWPDGVGGQLAVPSRPRTMDVGETRHCAMPLSLSDEFGAAVLDFDFHSPMQSAGPSSTLCTMGEACRLTSNGASPLVARVIQHSQAARYSRFGPLVCVRMPRMWEVARQTHTFAVRLSQKLRPALCKSLCKRHSPPQRYCPQKTGSVERNIPPSAGKVRLLHPGDSAGSPTPPRQRRFPAHSLRQGLAIRHPPRLVRGKRPIQ